ncbi:hypothetical protein HY29_14055 [Hyphomonas beringensis]|uniref:DUF6538 domain-containing protein n=1 Tax=Hyphomonas beringensis TaxID=1280946 RepID=A0A062U2Z9_9PROT|nr:DUF6538 domain-containing protein [Hyphomonas beringensis]KCZ54671.1 hypothetical protein HY29_14055 [Hyphomonas beringensis]
MAQSTDDDKFLKQRGGRYYYYRRVPTRLRPFYPSEFIRIALGTSSLEVARARRDELVDADESYWGKLRLSLDLERMGEPMDIEHARKRYEVAKARALAAGFRFRAMDELATPGMIDEVVSRLQAIERRAPSNGALNEEDVAAMLGAVEEPKVSVSEAMEIYQTKIAPPLLVKKSPQQKRRWKATKDLSLKYFVDVIGDLAMVDITREHGQKYYDFWNGEVSPSDPAAKPKQPKTADRHFGDIRRLYTDYFKYVGDETRLNPFRNLTFKDRRNRGTRKYPPFADKWVREKLLVPGWYERLTDEMFLAPLMIIETGCRPGEIINLRPKTSALTPRFRISSFQTAKITRLKLKRPCAAYRSSAFHWKRPSARRTVSRSITTRRTRFRRPPMPPIGA